jgi:hypothetical protein
MHNLFSIKCIFMRKLSLHISLEYEITSSSKMSGETKRAVRRQVGPMKNFFIQKFLCFEEKKIFAPIRINSKLQREEGFEYGTLWERMDTFLIRIAKLPTTPLPQLAKQKLRTVGDRRCKAPKRLSLSSSRVHILQEKLIQSW